MFSPPVSAIKNSLSNTIQLLVKEYPSVKRYEMAWGEQDPNKHLNNVNFLRYVERSRFDFIDQCIKSDILLDSKDFGIIVKALKINFYAPITFPDNLIVASSLGEFTKDRYTQITHIFSEKDEKLSAQAESVVLGYDFKAQKRCAFPKEFIDAFAALSVKNKL